jgi:hypothetical protein
MLNITQKDPGQFISTEARHDQAREDQTVYPRSISSDAKLVAAIEIHLLERLEARLHQKLHDVIDHLRKLADGLPTARHSANVILPGNKTIL